MSPKSKAKAALARVRKEAKRSQLAVSRVTKELKKMAQHILVKCVVCSHAKKMCIPRFIGGDNMGLLRRLTYLCDKCHPHCVLCKRKIPFVASNFPEGCAPPVVCGESCVYKRFSSVGDDVNWGRAVPHQLEVCKLDAYAKCTRHKATPLNEDSPPIECDACLEVWAFSMLNQQGAVGSVGW